MIPLSLYLNVDLLKLVLAGFINNDVLMYDKETGNYAKCRNSDLIDELG